MSKINSKTSNVADSSVFEGESNHKGVVWRSNDPSSATAEPNAPIATEPPSAVRCSAWLGHNTVHEIILEPGQKIPVIASDEKHAESLYNSMPPAHREACRIVIGQSRKEYLPS